MAKQRTVYVCSECGYESGNWSGRCPSCSTWNTMTEFLTDSKPGKSGSKLSSRITAKPKPLSKLSVDAESRFSTGISEMDRVLGGGAVIGSLNLVGGAPGIGKSTLLLQMCRYTFDRTVLYVTGEESERQLKLRADRLQLNSADSIYVLAENDISSVQAAVESIEPDILIIDSIQTISSPEVDAAPGSISQVRECTMKIMRMTKEKGITAFVVGHINKEGSIAGPKVLEHMVDCVLYFEGERNTSFRILRAVKNRFGSTNEIGVFEMLNDGLKCVENPSEMLLAGRPDNAPGSCVASVMEGTRPILAEVQALVSPAAYNPSRRSNGVDFNRSAMLQAVLDKRGGLAVTACDTYVNVIGGLFLEEPAADLAIILALASGFVDKPLGSDFAAVGEVGLSGEIRNVSFLNQRLTEIARLGFRKCVIPAHVYDELKQPKGLECIPVKNVREALAVSLGLY